MAVGAHLSVSSQCASAHPTGVCLRPPTDSIGGSDLLHIHHPDVHSSGSLKTWVKNSTNLNFVFIFISKGVSECVRSVKCEMRVSVWFYGFWVLLQSYPGRSIDSRITFYMADISQVGLLLEMYLFGLLFASPWTKHNIKEHFSCLVFAELTVLMRLLVDVLVQKADDKLLPKGTLAQSCSPSSRPCQVVAVSSLLFFLLWVHLEDWSWCALTVIFICCAAATDLRAVMASSVAYFPK